MTRTLLTGAAIGITLAALAGYAWLIGWGPQFEEQLYQWK